MRKDNGGPAFPQTQVLDGDRGFVSGNDVGEGGMTIRDYFAAKSLVGYLCCKETILAPDGSEAPDVLDDKYLAFLSYAMADAMLAERNK